MRVGVCLRCSVIRPCYGNLAAKAQLIFGWFGRRREIPIAVARQQSEDLALMFEWFDRVGYDADIAALRRDFSEVRWHSFADWAGEFDWSVLERTSSVV
jgi:hypothetical protein